MIQIIKKFFNKKINASDLNNYRRSCNAHYDDVCMQVTMNPAELYTQLATQAPKRETPVVKPEDNFVLPELTEAEEKELGDYIQQAYSMYEGLPPAQKFVAEVAPGTCEAISAYETKKFFEETKDAIKEGKFGEAALKGAFAFAA